MIDKKAKTSIPINELIACRWSGRAYNPAKTVSQEQIKALIEAARWSPSCFGDQPWRYIICDKNTNETAWNNAFGCLSEGNQSWARNAPVLILAIADSILSKNGNPNRWGQYDTGAASMSLCIQATELGLMVHQMGGFDTMKACEIFSIPDQFTPMAIMAVGYQQSIDELSGEIKERELSERLRNPVDKNFFNGVWGNPYKF